MNNLMKVVLLVAFVFTVSFSANAQGTGLKVGIVNLETIITELPAAKDADAQLKEIATQYQDSLINMRTRLEEDFQNYQKQQSMMTPEAKQQEEMKLQELQNTILQFQEQKFGQQGELTLMREQLLAPIRDKVQKAIDKVAKAEGINLVFDKTAAAVLYSEEKFDITFRVLDELKRGNE
jgi:outer membrane protein